jgi:formylglycine-generating enzyme required for sulfatase activity
MSLLPEKRYDTCSDFAQDLAQALTAAVTPETPKKKRGPAWIIAAGIAAVAAGTAAFFFVSERSRPQVQPELARVQTAAVEQKSPPQPSDVPKVDVSKDVPEVDVKKAAQSPAQAVAAPVKAETKTPEPSARPGESRVNAKDGLPYIWISPGKFSMGCSSLDDECNPDEKPVHTVTLTKGFWIGKTEVTQDAFQRVQGNNPSFHQGAGLPVENMTWSAARSYCEAVGMRLPTEAEWEYSARGGDLSSRYGALIGVAWFIGDSDKQAHKVGEKRANGMGLYDMLGNVWEWVADWYASYPGEPVTDPQGPPGGELRVMRGGAWNTIRRNVRVSIRDKSLPTSHFRTVGFRCAGGSL